MSNRKERYWGFRNQTDQNNFIKGVNYIIKACTGCNLEELHWSDSTDDYEIDIHINKKERKDEQTAER